MKIELKTSKGGEQEVTLHGVYSGVGIQTDMGLFGIAQRDDGIEVMLDGKTVWTSHEIPNADGTFTNPGPRARFEREPIKDFPDGWWELRNGESINGTVFVVDGLIVASTTSGGGIGASFEVAVDRWRCAGWEVRRKKRLT